jgi:hypothetical protein
MTSSSIPDEWWLNIAPLEPETYAPPPYTPSESADRNHDLFNQWRNNEFDSDGGSWLTDVGIGAAVMGIIGLFFLFCGLIFYCCCLRKSGGCCNRMKTKGKRHKITYVFFGISWIISLLGLAFLLHGSRTFNEEIQNAGDDAGLMADYLTDIQNLATTAVTSANNLIEASGDGIDNVETCILQSLLPIDITIDNSDFSNSLNDYVAEFQRVAFDGDITNAISNATDISHNIDDSTDGRVAGIVLFGIICALCLIVMAILVLFTFRKDAVPGDKNRCALCFRRFFLCITSLFFILGWLLLIFNVVMGMVAGDFCQDPDTYTLKVADDNSVIKFYMTCEGNSDLYNAVGTGQGLLGDAMAQTVTMFSLVTKFDIGCDDVVAEETSKITDAGYETYLILVGAGDTLKCEEINSIYIDAMHETVCVGLNKAVDFMMLGFLLQSLGFLLCLLFWKAIASQTGNIVPKNNLATPGTTAIVNGKNDSPHPLPTASAPIAS